MSARTDILRAFTGFAPPANTPDFPRWTWPALVVLAFGGTALYAASAAPFLPARPAWELTLTLVIATGGAWVVFGLGAVWWLCLPLSRVAAISLLTMGLGEGALLATALGNSVFLYAGVGLGFAPTVWNLGGLMAADAVMAIAMTRFFAQTGISPWRAGVLWIALLHGSAVLLALAADHFLP